MRIGINCTHVKSEHVGGINTYVFGLLNGFIHYDQQNTYQLYVDKMTRSIFESLQEYPNVQLIQIENSLRKRYISRCPFFLPGLRRFFPKYSALINQKDNEIIETYSDLLYIPTTWLSPHGLRIPTVISIHDIQQFHFPEFFSLKEKWIRSTLYDATIQHSTFVQASSQFIKKDLLNCYPGMITPERIFVVPEGVDIEMFARDHPTEDLNHRYNLPEEFLFYPAQLWPHKNHRRLFQALNKINKEYDCNIPLVLTGAAYKASTSIFSSIKKHKLGNQVLYLGKVPFQDLPGLYQLAKYLVMPVLYESSSLPILEAAASGTSILASSTPPNKEMAEKLKMRFFDPLSVSSMARVIYEAWKHRDNNQEAEEQNQEAVRYYSWAKIARQYLNLFYRIVY